jgi:hypothetical protein
MLVLVRLINFLEWHRLRDIKEDIRGYEFWHFMVMTLTGWSRYYA